MAAGFGPPGRRGPALVASPGAPAGPAALDPAEHVPPRLAGFTVVVATERRNHEIAEWLEASGARIMGVRAVRTIAQPDPVAINDAISMCVAEPVHEVIVSSAFGLRAWVEAARRGGHLEGLLSCFREARLLARDARTADGIRELGLTQIWSTAAGTVEDLFRYLNAQPMTGRRVVAHIESDAHRELCDALRTAGATVVEVATAQFGPPRMSMLSAGSSTWSCAARSTPSSLPARRSPRTWWTRPAPTGVWTRCSMPLLRASWPCVSVP